MMHAENGPAIDVLAAQLAESGKTAPYYHGIARAWQMEEEATHRAIMLADLTDAPLYVVHMSAKQAVAQVAWARDNGKNVFGETCPQYLYLSLEKQLGAKSDEWGDFEGAKWVCSTPLRSEEEGHLEAMWQGLRTNDLQMVSTDHCPFCMKDQKELGKDDFRAIQLAKVGAAPLYIVHLSASEALENVAAARDAGANVFAETCPQYLYLNLEDHLGAPGFAGAGYVCSTPLRTKHEHHHADLWKGLRSNDLSVVSTDHCPFCMKDQKELGRDDFRAIPNGIGGIEHRMDLIYQGVAAGELTLPRWVELCSTTPARMFGLYPRKGVIAPGSDADIVLYDPDRPWTISVDNHHMNLDYSAYEGIEVSGRVDTVLSRGRVILRGEEYLGSPGDGQYLRRGLCDYLQ